jgi:hypothetical protein
MKHETNLHKESRQVSKEAFLLLEKLKKKKEKDEKI